MFDVIESIQSMAARNRLAPALIGSNIYLTYEDLLDKVARVSNYLADRKVPRRSKVYLNISDPNLRLIVALASLHYGLMPFILLELGNIRDEIDYDFVIGSPRPHAPDVPADITIDQALLDGKLADGRLREFPPLVDDDILFVATTTGTTGRRKLVAQINGPWVQRNSEPLRYAPDDRVMFTIGDVALYGFTLSCQILRAGAAIVRKTTNMAENLKLISKYSVNKMVTTPSALERLMDNMDQLGVRCPTVKQISITGSLFHGSLVARLAKSFTAQLRVAYGSSEVGRVSEGAINPDAFKVGYVGELWPALKVISTGTEAAPAQITVINDKTRINSYYSKGKTVRDEQSFYALPDLGYLDGYSLYLVGRDDEVFNISGNKFAFSTIEGAVRGLPGVRDVAVGSAATVGDPLGLIIAIVSDGMIDMSAAVERVVKLVRLRTVEKHLRIFRIPEIVRNDMGKIDRKALVDAYAAQRKPFDQAVPPAMSRTVGHA